MELFFYQCTNWNHVIQGVPVYSNVTNQLWKHKYSALFLNHSVIFLLSFLLFPQHSFFLCFSRYYRTWKGFEIRISVDALKPSLLSFIAGRFPTDIWKKNGIIATNLRILSDRCILWTPLAVYIYLLLCKIPLMTLGKTLWLFYIGIIQWE